LAHLLFQSAPLRPFRNRPTRATYSKQNAFLFGQPLAKTSFMNTPPMRAISITSHPFWPCCPDTGRKGPQGEVRPVEGPHSPFFEGPRISLPLTYILKMIEPVSCRVLSATRMAGPEEAQAALRLLGPTSLQPVLISKSAAHFFPRLL